MSGLFVKIFPYLFLLAPMILLTLGIQYLVPVSFILYFIIIMLMAFRVAWVWWLNLFNVIYILIFYVPHLLIMFPSIQSVYLALTALMSIPYLLIRRKMFNFLGLPINLIISLGLGILIVHNIPMIFMQMGFIETPPIPPAFLGIFEYMPSPFSLINWISPITTTVGGGFPSSYLPI